MATHFYYHYAIESPTKSSALKYSGIDWGGFSFSKYVVR